MQISQGSNYVRVNKVAGPQNVTLSKRGSNTGFSCEFCESSQNTYFVEDLWTAGSETPAHLFTNTFFYRTSPVAASDSFRFPACIFIKKGTPVKMFSVNFAKFLRTSFCRTPPDGCFLCLPVILRSFSDHLFHRAPLGNCLLVPPYFMYKFRISTNRYNKKYFTTAFQALYTKTRRSYSEAFI